MNIIMVSPVDGDAVDTLRHHHRVVTAVNEPPSEEALRDQEVLVMRSGVEITRDIIDLAPRLGLIVRAGSGFDNIDLDYARRRGIRVVRIPGPAADAVAEYTFGLFLALTRQIVRADALVRIGLWPKQELGGILLGGKVLGIVGAGNIGTRVGELGSAWGMRVIGCIEPNVRWQPPPFIEACDLSTVLRRADILTVHTPLTDATRALIGADEMASMPQGAYLVSTARGGVVDEVALYEALDSGHLAGAALDVHEEEGDGTIPKLANLPNVVLTPHIAGMAIESQRAIGSRMVELINAYADDELDSVLTGPEELL